MTQVIGSRAARMAIEQRALTLDEFLALAEEEPALELEPDGTVSQKVSPKGQHSALQLALCEHINAFARPRHLALAFPSHASYSAARHMCPGLPSIAGIAFRDSPVAR